MQRHRLPEIESLIRSSLISFKINEISLSKSLIRKLGYDAFTTIESGKNVMLFNPNEQFIPLFDPLKKSTIGFSTGGGLSSLNERV